MTVLATAGHVDHGKSTFVNFLTGQETDRLKKKKIHGLTINLGYHLFLALKIKEYLLLMSLVMLTTLKTPLQVCKCRRYNFLY